MTEPTPCPDCLGHRGYRSEEACEPCPTCDGAGTIPDWRQALTRDWVIYARNGVVFCREASAPEADWALSVEGGRMTLHNGRPPKALVDACFILARAMK